MINVDHWPSCEQCLVVDGAQALSVAGVDGDDDLLRGRRLGHDVTYSGQKVELGWHWIGTGHSTLPAQASQSQAKPQHGANRITVGEDMAGDVDTLCAGEVSLSVLHRGP